MDDPGELLARHRPVVRYDSHEIYFADSAAGWTDTAGQTLRRGPQGAVLAQSPPSPPLAALSLSFLGPERYADGTAVRAEDEISCPQRDYAKLAGTLHAEEHYANRVYGRSCTGSDERLWLQYWFFYFYNDFELLGSEFPAGLHEGDWEMIQLRLDAQGLAPDLAVYAKHKHAEARPWANVELVGGARPVIYIARGSHAAYFTRGTHWGEAWFDHADGHGPSPELTLEIAGDDDESYAWIRWHGFWGDTKPNPDHILHPLDDTSPRGPGGHAQWRDPVALLRTAEGHERFEALVELRAPAISLERDGSELRIRYSCGDWPRALVPVRLIVTVRPPVQTAPAAAQSIPIETPDGVVELGQALLASAPYEVLVSIAGRPASGAAEGAPPLTSPSTSAELAAA
jgi:hypothetical protein